MTLFLRQRNEALDEDQKTLREQLGLYKKQVEKHKILYSKYMLPKQF